MPRFKTGKRSNMSNVFNWKIGAICLIFLFGSSFIIYNWNNVQASNNVVCTSCIQSKFESQSVDIKNIIILEGEEKDKGIFTSIRSQDYINVKQVLTEKGFIPQIENATAQVIKLLINNTSIEMVLVPFKKSIEFSAGIIFATFENHTFAIGGIYNEETKHLFSSISIDSQFLSQYISLAKSYRYTPCSIENDECWSDDDCHNLYGPGWCCVQATENFCYLCGDCVYDYECMYAYGPGYHCVNGTCMPFTDCGWACFQCFNAFSACEYAIIYCLQHNFDECLISIGACAVAILTEIWNWINQNGNCWICYYCSGG